jgi:membrane protease YdiL (CAAX protease family)
VIAAVIACVTSAALGHATGRGLARSAGGRGSPDTRAQPAPLLAVLAVLGALAASGGLVQLALAPTDMTTRLVATLAGWLAALGTARGLGLDLAWGRAGARSVLLGAALGAFAAAVTHRVTHAGAGSNGHDPVLAELANGEVAARAGLALYVILVAPALEEAVMRGAVQGQLARVSPGGAVLASTLLFAALHPGTWGARGPVIVLGLLAAGARHVTGRVLPSVAVHMAWNATVLALR